MAALYYGVTYLDTTQIVSANAPTETASVASFECTVTRERLTAKPVIDYPDEDSARAALEPTLHAWEATTELIDGYPVRFDFEQSQMEVVDPSVAVGTALTGGPPHRSQRAELPHWAPASGSGSEAHFREGMLHAGGW